MWQHCTASFHHRSRFHEGQGKPFSYDEAFSFIMVDVALDATLFCTPLFGAGSRLRARCSTLLLLPLHVSKPSLATSAVAVATSKRMVSECSHAITPSTTNLGWHAGHHCKPTTNNSRLNCFQSVNSLHSLVWALGVIT